MIPATPSQAVWLCLVAGLAAAVVYADSDAGDWAFLKNLKASDPKPPVILIPGLLSTRLVAWKKKECIGPNIEAQQLIWLNLGRMIESTTFDPYCWLDCMKIGPNGSDPHDCKVRPDEGLNAISELSPGSLYTPPATTIFTPLIRMLADDLGFDVNTITAAPCECS
jgi:hypothetical protein